MSNNPYFASWSGKKLSFFERHCKCPQKYFFTKHLPLLNSIQTGGGGTLWPPYHESVCCVHRVRAKLTKSHDCVPLKNWKVSEESVFEFFWKFFENWTTKIFGGPRACQEKSKKLKKIPFFAKNLIFSGWICFVYVLSFLLRYITLL